MTVYEKTYVLDGQTAAALLFVDKARLKKGCYTADRLDRIHVTDGYAIATDGKRLHKAPVPKSKDVAVIEDGDYKVLAKTSKTITLAKYTPEVAYVDWRKVIPTGPADKITTYLSVKRSGTTQAIQAAKLVVRLAPDAVVRHGYLADLPECTWQVEYRKPDGAPFPLPLIFTCGDYMAAIMPVNTEDYR